MSTWYLLNTTRVGTSVFYAGAYIDDTATDTTNLLAAGGKLWPSADAAVATAASRCQALRLQGQSGNELDDIMSAAVDTSIRTPNVASEGALNIGIADAGSYYTGTSVEAALQEIGAGSIAIKKRTIVMSYALFSGLGAGTKTYTLADTVAMPSSARIAGFSIDAMTGFDDPTHGNFAIEVGVAGVNDVMASTSVKAGSTAAPKAGTSAGLGYFGAPAVGTASVKMTSAVDLNTATVGSVTVSVFYFVA